MEPTARRPLLCRGLAWVVVTLVLVAFAPRADAWLRPDANAAQGPEAGDEQPSVPATAAATAAAAGPKAGQRWIVGVGRGAPRRTRRDVRDLVQQLGGQVAVESGDLDNTFVAFEATSADAGTSIASAVGKAGLRGVAFIEPDVPRFPMGRRLEGEELAAAARRLQQGPQQPYGLAKVEATAFTTAQRSTTSSVNATARFPICIIDSGFDITHPGLQGVKLLSGDPTGYTTDNCGHGTHVAGTIAARTTIDGVLNGAVELSIVKVFGDGPACGWVYASGLAAAMQKCRSLGARIVSMSLGGPTSSTAERNAADALYGAGMLLFAAAGNEASKQLSYPAAYDAVVSVAATDQANEHAPFSNFNADVEVAAPGVGVLSTVPASVVQAPFTVAVAGGPSFEARSNGQLRLADKSAVSSFAGLAQACTATACSGNFAGAVCIIPRGTSKSSSICAPAARCAAAGGVAAVMVGGTSGPAGWSASLKSCSQPVAIPVFTLARDAAPAFANGRAVTGTLGPKVLYEAWSGTSMATPHASAVAALVWGQRPACNNAAIRCALQRGALDLGAAGRDTSFGFGLVRASSALSKISAGCAC